MAGRNARGKVRGGAATLNRRQVLQAGLALAATGLLPRGARAAAPPQGPFDVVIVGAGLAGLAAAFQLRDQNILALEKQPTVGGRGASGQWHGFTYPQGTEYIGNPTGEVAAMFGALGLRTVAVPQPAQAVALGGRFHTGADYLSFLANDQEKAAYARLRERVLSLKFPDAPTGLADRSLLDPAVAALDGKTVAAWLQAEGAPGTVAKLVEAGNRSRLAASNQELSALYDLPSLAANLADAQGRIPGGAQTFVKGISELVGALAKELGPRVLTDATVVEIKKHGKGVSVTYQTGDQRHTVEAAQVIVTPAPAISALLVPHDFSPAVQKALRSIPQSTCASLNLFLKTRPRVPAWSALCLDTSFVNLSDAIRLQVPAEYQGESILGLFLASAPHDDPYLAKAPEADILAQALKDLEKYLPGVSGQVLGHDLKRFGKAYPVMRPGYLEVLEVLHHDPSARGPVILSGDHMVYPTAEGSLQSGFRAAALAHAAL